MKKIWMKAAALVLVLTLAASSLSGCITIALLTTAYTAQKIKEGRKDPTEEETVGTTAAEKPTGEETESPTQESKPADTDAVSSFHEFTDRVFGEIMGSSTLNMHYYVSDPERFGIDTSEVCWWSMDVTDETVQEYKDRLEGWEKELKSFDRAALDKEGQLTYDAFSWYIEVEKKCLGLDLLYEPLGANSGLQAMLPLELAEYNFYSESDVEDYLALLELIPEFYKDIIEFEQQKADAGLFMEDDILENTISQVEDFLKGKEDSFLISTFEERLETLELGEAAKKEYAERNKKIVSESFYPAYEYLLEELPKFKGKNKYQGGLCNYPDGKEYYAYLLQAKTGSDMTPEEMIKALERAIDEGLNTLTMMLRQNRSLYNVFEQDVYPTRDPNLALRMLQEKILADFPEVPEVDYSVSYVDASLRDYLSPACYMIPPIDTEVKNSILINCDRGDEPEDIYITLAHEGYPGHLYQVNYFKNSATYLLRDAIGTNGFAEGYATYVENNAFHYIDELSDDAAEVLKANAQISLYIYARVDLGIHYEGWDVDDVADYIGDYFDGAEDAAKWMYDYMRPDPATYEQYAIGELEIISIENEARDADNFDIKAFHTALLDASEAPFEVIRKFVLE